jgi:hypothetical protein
MNNDQPTQRRRSSAGPSWVGSYVETTGDLAELWARQMNEKYSSVHQHNWNNPGGNVFIEPGD